MLRLYLDEDAMSAALVRGLAAHQMDVSTPVQVGARGRTDPEQLALAAAAGRSLYTFNARDFARLHAEWMRTGRHHAGIIVVNDQLMPIGEQLRRLLRLAAVLDAADMEDRIEFLGAWR